MTDKNKVPVPSIEVIIQPFLKWAGGKRWLIDHYSEIFPRNFNRYIEPFLGGGAVFFRLRPSNSILSDANQDLISTYQAIKTDWQTLLERLHIHQEKHDKAYYYKMRAALPSDPIERAARFIYLNRTCWNGLYRVNKHGEFNVPIGTKENVLLNTDDFSLTASVLNCASLEACDFEKTIDQAVEGDLIYADPPYTVKHNLNGFIKYNQKIFSWDDQIRLRDALERAVSRGAWVISSNANHESIHELYRDNFKVGTLPRKSVIAASSSKRGDTSELIIAGGNAWTI